MKRSLFYLILILSPVLVHAADTVLGGVWRFRTDPYDRGIEQQWWQADHNTADWDLLKVPGNWDTTPAYSTYLGTAWYQTHFTITPEDDSILRLLFEGVATDADVWLNGILLGSHDFAFTRFSFDITDKVFYDKENTLTVRVSNRFKVGATWSYGGIRRPVLVQQLPARGIETIKISSQTDAKRKEAEVRISALMRNPGNDGGHEAKIRIFDNTGRPVAEKKVKSQNDTVSGTFKLKNIRLWHFDRPHLYTAIVTCANDTAEERFGLREICVDGERFLLNGEPVRLCGANWVPDSRFSGNTLPAALYRQDIDMMKEAGVNMARLSHQALPEDVLDYLDEKGILIFEEIPLWNKNEMVSPDDPTPLRWLGELVEQRSNHPCIVGWSVGNEIGRSSDNPQLQAYLRQAFDFLHRVDSRRMAVYVTHTAAKQPDEPAALADMILFNQYGAHGERADRVHEYNPGKPIFYSEYGKSVNRASLDGNVDYRAMLDDMSGRPFLAGASVWTFNDYRTNYRDASTDAAGNRPWGAVDAYRRRKRAYRSLQRANSPLRVFRCDTTGTHTFATIRPRRSDEIPAYTLSDYRIEARAVSDTAVLWSKYLPLPIIKPGDGELKIDLGNYGNRQADRIELTLLAPAGYAVNHHTLFLKAPAKPEITAVEIADTKCRIHFNKESDTQEYSAEYTLNGTTKQTAPTIENYIEMDLPDFNCSYDITLVAHNEAGSTRSLPTSVTPRAAILPPVVLYAHQTGNELHIAFTSDMQDYYYDIEYWAEGDIDQKKTLTVTTGGACVIEVDDPEKQYFVRMNRHLAYGYASPMSLTVKIEK